MRDARLIVSERDDRRESPGFSALTSVRKPPVSMAARALCAQLNPFARHAAPLKEDLVCASDVERPASVSPASGTRPLLTSQELPSLDNLGSHLVAAIANGGAQEGDQAVRTGAKGFLHCSDSVSDNIADRTTPARVDRGDCMPLGIIQKDRKTIRVKGHEGNARLVGDDGIGISERLALGSRSTSSIRASRPGDIRAMNLPHGYQGAGIKPNGFTPFLPHRPGFSGVARRAEANVPIGKAQSRHPPGQTVDYLRVDGQQPAARDAFAKIAVSLDQCCHGFSPRKTFLRRARDNDLPPIQPERGRR